jgi:hypothetical protein
LRVGRPTRKQDKSLSVAGFLEDCLQARPRQRHRDISVLELDLEFRHGAANLTLACCRRLNHLGWFDIHVLVVGALEV